jgi:hypothetical protein
VINLQGRELTKFIKLQLLKYWRFDRQYIFCCTEGINKSDVNAINDKYLIEIEVKISKSDFLSEFSGKSRVKSYKHRVYNEFLSKNNTFLPQSSKFGAEKECKSGKKEYKNSEKECKSSKNNGLKLKKGYIVPNFYYFCTTEELKNYVLDYINKFYPNYGLLVCSSKRVFNKRSHIICVKKAKNLTNKDVTKEMFMKIGKRVQSELITLRETSIKIKD